MGIFKKFGDMARANINHLLGQMEDPKKLTELAIVEMQESKKKAEALLITVTAALKTAEEKLRTLPEQASLLTMKAENFLRNSDETHAKAALREKHVLDVQIKMLEQEIAANAAAQASLKTGIKSIDEKISEMKSSSSVNASLRELNKADAFDTFARMEEKIEGKEFEVEALNELVSDLEKNNGVKKAHDNFDKFSDPDVLEKELAAIKNKIGG